MRGRGGSGRWERRKGGCGGEKCAASRVRQLGGRGEEGGE